uniref:Uncharacterized protein n=1 Tax=Anopheles maculatus TaxID=74869 RepID=A0A182SGW4_9DIPT
MPGNWDDILFRSIVVFGSCIECLEAVACLSVRQVDAALFMLIPPVGPIAPGGPDDIIILPLCTFPATPNDGDELTDAIAVLDDEAEWSPFVLLDPEPEELVDDDVEPDRLPTVCGCCSLADEDEDELLRLVLAPSS